MQHKLNAAQEYCAPQGLIFPIKNNFRIKIPEVM